MEATLWVPWGMGGGEEGFTDQHVWVCEIVYGFTLGTSKVPAPLDSITRKGRVNKQTQLSPVPLVKIFKGAQVSTIG
jgi:hypothetical protein